MRKAINSFLSSINPFSSRSIEDPAQPITAEYLADISGGQSSSGARVTEETAKRLESVLTAIKIISEDVGKTPLHVYKETEAGKEKDRQHMSYRLARRKPSAYVTAKVFRQTLQGHALTQGNGYAYIDRDGAGRPIEMRILDPTSTTPIKINGILYYEVSTSKGSTLVFADQIFHIKGLGFDGITGYSMVNYAANLFGYGISTENYGAKFFENGATPGVVLESPSKLDDVAAKRLSAQWQALHAGSGNAHRTAVLEEGTKVSQFTVNAKDAQLIEQNQQIDRKIAALYRIPPHKLGDTTRTGYNSLEEENLSYLNECLDSWFVTWEDESWDKLLTEDEKRSGSHYFEFTREALIRANMKAKAEYYQKALGGAPWMAINEVRGQLNMNKADSEEFDTIQMPTNNFGEPEQDDSVTQADADPQEEENSRAVEETKNLLNHARERMKKRVSKSFERAKTQDKINDIIENFDRLHGKVILDEFEPIARVMESITGEENLSDRYYDEFVNEMKKR